MKKIENLRDVESVLRDLEQRFNRWETTDIDLKGRRIRGAPSRHPSDYVTRAELFRAIGDLGAAPFTPQAVSEGDGYWTGTFGVGINTELLVQDNIAPPHLVVESGVIDRIAWRLKQPAGGSSVIFELHVNSNNVTRERLIRVEIEAGDTFMHVQDNVLAFDRRALDLNSWVELDIKQVGSSVVGGSLVVKFRYK